MDEIEAAVCAAIDAGYRHIDCAWNYGNQEGVGRALEKKIKDGVINRGDMFITTKVELTAVYCIHIGNWVNVKM